MRLCLWIMLCCLAWAQPAELTSLGREYQELRKQSGHFSGGGEWNSKVDRWNGRKHQVMAELAEKLGSGQSTQILLAVMGEPDARQGSQWLYYWRGRHDYLIFDCQQGKIVKSEWWMAGE